MPEPHWLTQTLLSALENEWCVSSRCTTCGAEDFRKAIKLGLLQDQNRSEARSQISEGSGEPFCQDLSHEEAYRLIAQLVDVVRPAAEPDDMFPYDPAPSRWDEAVRLLLNDVRLALAASDVNDVIFRELQGTPAGSVFEGMIQYEASRRRRREYELRRNCPERAAMRRAGAQQRRQLSKLKRDRQLELLGIAIYGTDVARSDLYKRMAAARTTLAYDQLRDLD